MYGGNRIFRRKASRITTRLEKKMQKTTKDWIENSFLRKESIKAETARNKIVKAPNSNNGCHKQPRKITKNADKTKIRLPRPSAMGSLIRPSSSFLGSRNLVIQSPAPNTDIKKMAISSLYKFKTNRPSSKTFIWILSWNRNHSTHQYLNCSRENLIIQISQPAIEKLAVGMGRGRLIEMNTQARAIDLMHAIHFNITTFTFLEGTR